MRALLMMAALLAALAWPAANGIAAERYGKQKVVYHINYDGGKEDQAYITAMRNVQNHINAVGAENIEVKVVLHGKGVDLLKDAMTNEKVKAGVANLKGQNVGFNVCANTLKGRKITTAQLYEVFDEDVVPSGVAELSRLQQMGYTYIKP